MNNTKYKILSIDMFVVINILLFLMLIYVVPLDRFLFYLDHDNLPEFIIYAISILTLILVSWRMLRHIRIPILILILAQIGIIMHCAGALIFMQEYRLFDKIILGIRYDKYVHVFTGFMGATILHEIYFKNLNLNFGIKDVQLLIMMLGIGAVWEIVEYLVTIMLTINGVGNYDNNMQDLISNLIGTTVFIFVNRISNIIMEKRSR